MKKKERSIRSRLVAYRALLSRKKEDAVIWEQMLRDLEWLLQNAVFIDDEEVDTDDLVLGAGPPEGESQ